MNRLSTNRDVILCNRLFHWARPYWQHLGILFALSLLASPLALLVPLPLKIAVDSGLASKPLPHFIQLFLPISFKLSPFSALVVAVLLLILVTVLIQVQALAVSLLRTYTAEKLLLDFRSELFRQMQKLSLGYHEVKGTAESLYNLQYDAAAVQTLVVDHLIPFFNSAFTLLGMLYVTARIDWQLALVALVISPVIYATSKHYRRGLRHGSHEVKKLEKYAMGIVQEVLGALRVVKAFGREEDERQRFLRKSEEGMWARLQLALAEGKFNSIVGLTMAAGTATVLFVGIRQVQTGVITLGELLLMMGYVAQLYEPLKTMGRKSAALQSQLASVERSFALLDEISEVEEKPDAQPLFAATGKINFESVSFTYPGHRPALVRVSFEVQPGTCVGIVGPTGAGKTTLISLMLRFYDPVVGRILLDSTDLRDYKLADLRNQFALVPQESVLFSTSIEENIAYARPDATQGEIEAAATAANAHGFISRLPEGYQTVVGERGLRLSGGERQRISLARAFLKNSPILILDEPTSSVDVETEAAILEALERLIHGRTTFVIAHRASTLIRCNAILQIDNGEVIAKAPASAAIASAEPPALQPRSTGETDAHHAPGRIQATAT